MGVLITLKMEMAVVSKRRKNDSVEKSLRPIVAQATMIQRVNVEKKSMFCGEHQCPKALTIARSNTNSSKDNNRPRPPINSQKKHSSAIYKNNR
jgi:hypothetical protein